VVLPGEELPVHGQRTKWRVAPAAVTLMDGDVPVTWSRGVVHGNAVKPWGVEGDRKSPSQPAKWNRQEERRRVVTREMMVPLYALAVSHWRDGVDVDGHRCADAAVNDVGCTVKFSPNRDRRRKSHYVAYESLLRNSQLGLGVIGSRC